MNASEHGSNGEIDKSKKETVFKRVCACCVSREIVCGNALPFDVARCNVDTSECAWRAIVATTRNNKRAHIPGGLTYRTVETASQ